MAKETCENSQIVKQQAVGSGRCRGNQETFLGEDAWYSVRIGEDRILKIKLYNWR